MGPLRREAPAPVILRSEATKDLVLQSGHLEKPEIPRCARDDRGPRDISICPIIARLPVAQPGKSNGLLSRGSQVQILPGRPTRTEGLNRRRRFAPSTFGREAADRATSGGVEPPLNPTGQAIPPRFPARGLFDLHRLRQRSDLHRPRSECPGKKLPTKPRDPVHGRTTRYSERNFWACTVRS